MARWIPATRKLPPIWEPVLAYDSISGDMGRAVRLGAIIGWQSHDLKHVTHWQPLPKPPRRRRTGGRP